MADPTASTYQLVGRDRELEMLAAFLDDTFASGSARLLTGEPGVGKTALMDAAAEMAATRGARVIRGSGVEYESDVSFAGLHQLVDPLAEDLRRLPEATRGTLDVALGVGPGSAPDRLSVLGAALSLFREAAREAPLLIVIDDLQWLDRASGAVVGFVGRRLQGSRIGLLGALRPGFGGFFERAGIPEDEVLPLPEREALQLLARLFAHLPARVMQGVVDDAQGIPLALLEFAASAGGPHDPTHPRPRTGREVRTLFQARLDRLPGPTRQLLLLAALDGSGGLGALAAAAADHGGLGQLGPAERDHLVVADGQAGEIRFRHPMIRTVLVEGSTIAERREAHERLATVFEGEPERRGHHLAEAALAPDEAVASAVEAGAERTLQRGDVVGAISRFLRAADLSPDPRDRSRRLADAAYLGAHSAGQLDSSSELLRAAVRRDPTLSEALHAAVATAFLLLNSDGDAETTHRLLTVAIESALEQAEPDRGGLAEGLYTLVLVCHYADRSEFWAPFHRAMDRLGEAAPTEVRLLAETLADPLTASAWALSELDHTIQRLGSTDEFDLIIRTAIAAFYTDRLPTVRDELRRVVLYAPGGGAEGSVMMALSMLAFEAIGSGQWDTAMRTASEAAELWEERHFRLYAWNGRYAMALVAGNRGDRVRSRELCDAMFAWAAPRQLGILEVWGNHALAQAALAAGDFEEGYARACAITPPGTLRSHTPQALWSALDLVDAALHSGHVPEARAHALALRHADLGRVSPRYRLVSMAVDAMTTSDDQSTDLFRAALAVPGAADWPFELARVRLAYGERLRRLRRTREARQQLDLAREGFDQLGAVPWSRRASTEASATGATRRTLVGGGLASLTPQERRVADLAASGLTNREIAARLYVSPRTVSAHLYRVYPKLGVASRAALRDALGPTREDAAT